MKRSMTNAEKARAYDDLRNQASSLGYATVGEVLDAFREKRP